MRIDKCIDPPIILISMVNVHFLEFADPNVILAFPCIKIYFRFYSDLFLFAFLFSLYKIFQCTFGIEPAFELRFNNSIIIIQRWTKNRFTIQRILSKCYLCVLLYSVHELHLKILYAEWFGWLNAVYIWIAPMCDVCISNIRAMSGSCLFNN